MRHVIEKKRKAAAAAAAAAAVVAPKPRSAMRRPRGKVAAAEKRVQWLEEQEEWSDDFDGEGEEDAPLDLGDIGSLMG